jgi:ribosomal protein L29
MKKTQKKDLRTKTIEELKKILKDKRLEFERVRLERGAAKAKNVRLFTLKKREMATILTIIAEKEFQKAMQK